MDNIGNKSETIIHTSSHQIIILETTNLGKFKLHRSSESQDNGDMIRLINSLISQKKKFDEKFSTMPIFRPCK